MPEKKFSDVFKERVDEMERRARAIGMSLTAVCRKAGISRATPDRWRHVTPHTIALLDKMEEVVAAETEVKRQAAVIQPPA